ncbi:Probable transposable element [Penicillium roqueforti FM164]|uniref:Probable transposable element n=1 Tax=Penicillium roqueforti (strain FM164) TaxID=1365484 RepID=W6QWE6_PENRF|nr:Probable transposable element [Penicillium roqueforti FM164]
MTCSGIEAIINEALDWERRSRATFKAEKIAIIHFAPKIYKLDYKSFIIKEQTVVSKEHVKILGVLMDTRLKYKEYMARAVSKGLEVAIELRRLYGLSLVTARQLFISTVALVIDYASNVWIVAEAEAYIATARNRFWRRAVKMWTDIYTFPEINPLCRGIDWIRKFRRYYRSLLY